MTDSEKSRLGRGLNALLGGKDDVGEKSELEEINIERIEPNPHQPRQDMGEEELEELSHSIAENGVLQPVILTPAEEGYYLVAGERRWRAAKMAGLERLPAVIRDIDEEQMMELALVENIHRQDLNPLEEARAYRRLQEEFELTQAELASRLGRSRSAISNTMRLLNLDSRVQEYVSRETLSAGQARALAGLEEEEKQRKAAERVIEDGMNVRQAEEYVSSLKQEGDSKQEIPPDGKSGDNEDDVLDELDRFSRQLDEIEKSEDGEESPADGDLISSVEEEARLRQGERLCRRLKELLEFSLELVEKGESWQLQIEIESMEGLEELIARLEE